MKHGTVLVPKPEHESMFVKGAKYVVTMADIERGAVIGEYWMEQPTCDVCGSTDISENPHMGRNCNWCNPLGERRNK